MAKFTFKSYPRPTGLERICSGQPSIQIKLKKKQCGTIHSPTWRDIDNDWKIMFMIKSNDHPGWKWITLKARFKTSDEAKLFLNEKVDVILNAYPIRTED